MTKKRRVINFITGILLILFGPILVTAGEDGIGVVLFMMFIAFFIGAVQGFWFYFTMARHMVGGKTMLYRSLILLDLSAFSFTVGRGGALMGVLYVAAIQFLAGAIGVLRAADAKRFGGHWRLMLVYGIICILFALAVIVSGLMYHSFALAVIVYSIGLFTTGISRVVSAFRRTAIVYIPSSLFFVISRRMLYNVCYP